MTDQYHPPGSCDACTHPPGQHPLDTGPARDPYQYRLDQWVISQLTLNAVQAEATRAHLKHGDGSMIGAGHTDADRFAILAEEAAEASDEALAAALGLLTSGGLLTSKVGQIARELNETALGNRPIGDRTRLVRELIQLAAMALTWVEAIEGGGPAMPPGPGLDDQATAGSGTTG